jgi:hypothetical protein
VDFGKSFQFILEDENWVSRVVIGSLIALIPLIGAFVVLGYMVKIAENVARGQARPLPDWSDFGDLLVRGLYVFVISLVYSLPLLLLVAFFSCGIFAIAGMASAGGEDAAAPVAFFALLLNFVFFAAVIIGSLLVSILAYAGIGRYVATGTLSEALRVSEVLRSVRSRPGPWLKVLLASILAGLFASLGIIACGIGVIFTSFISYCVLGHAIGQTVASEGMSDRGAGTYTPPAASSF